MEKGIALGCVKRYLISKSWELYPTSSSSGTFSTSSTMSGLEHYILKMTWPHKQQLISHYYHNKSVRQTL